MGCVTVRLLYAMAVMTIPFFINQAAQAKIVEKPIQYAHENQTLEGHLVYDDARTGKQSGVLVIHAWWGHDEYARMRARKLAELGHVAFALDMYGKGNVTDKAPQASKWATRFYENLPLMRARATAGLEVLRSQPNVNRHKIAAIGYCFGGTVALQLAYSGVDIAGVVSFHGNPLPPGKEDYENIHASILICHGADDQLVKPATLEACQKSLREAEADWQLISYGNAVHSFTNPNADGSFNEFVRYNAEADARSWRHMQMFFQDVFGD